VPADYRFRANDHQARAPIAQPGQQGQAHSSRGIDASRFHAPLLEEPELATQHTGLKRCSKLGRPLRLGARTSTKSGRTVAASECRRPVSQRCIGSKPPMQRNQPPKESFTLEPGLSAIDWYADRGQVTNESSLIARPVF